MISISKIPQGLQPFIYLGQRYWHFSLHVENKTGDNYFQDHLLRTIERPRRVVLNLPSQASILLGNTWLCAPR